MKTEPLKLTIDGEEVTFGTIGFRVYVDATKQIRAHKEHAFSRIASSLTHDPLTSASAAASAIDGYMSGMIVGDFEVNQWMFSPEGEHFLFGYSLRKANPDISQEKIDDLFDAIGPDEKNALSDFYTKCIMKNRYTPPKTDKTEDKESLDSDKD